MKAPAHTRLQLTAVGICRAGGRARIGAWSDHPRPQLGGHPFDSKPSRVGGIPHQRKGGRLIVTCGDSGSWRPHGDARVESDTPKILMNNGSTGLPLMTSQAISGHAPHGTMSHHVVTRFAQAATGRRERARGPGRPRPALPVLTASQFSA
jgi:hypothetical protein